MYRAVEPYRRVIEVVNGFQGSRILQMGLSLDVFTKLANERKTVVHLARQLGVDARALELLLNGLVALGFLAKESDRYGATPLAQTYLARGGPKYIGSFVRSQAHRWAEWGRLEEAIHTGKPVRKRDASDPEDLELCVRGMHELALACGDARHLARVLPLENCHKLLDLGSGPGTYAAMLCRTFPNLRATVVDQPRTLEITRRILREFDMTRKVSTLGADVLHEPIPGGPYDAALLSNILEGEDEETDMRLLDRVREALSPGGLLVVKEHCMSPDRTEPDAGALFALSLLLGTRGRTYSFAELSGWIEAAGFIQLVEIPPEPPMTTSLLLALQPGGRPLAALPRPAAVVEEPSAKREAPVLHDWWPANTSSDVDPARFPSAAWMEGPAVRTVTHRAARTRPSRRRDARRATPGSRSNGSKKRPAATPKFAAGKRSSPKARSKRA